MCIQDSSANARQHHRNRFKEVHKLLGVEPTAPFSWVLLLSSQVLHGHRTQIRTRISLCFICCGRISHECVANLKRLGIAREERNWTEFMLRVREPLLKFLLGESLFRTTYTVFFHCDCFWAVELETNTSARNFSVAEGLGATRGKEEEIVSNNLSSE